MAVAELLPAVLSMVLGSAVPAVAVLLIVELLAAFDGILTTIVNCAVSALVADAFAKAMVPLPPMGTASVRDQPAGKLADTRVVPAGMGSDTVTLKPVSGPLLMKLMVYVRLLP